MIVSAYDEAPAYAESAVATAAGSAKTLGAQTTTKVIKGSPADVIVESAEEEFVELIVVGNKGMAGSKRALLGTVPDRVSHHAPCDLLIVRTDDQDEASAGVYKKILVGTDGSSTASDAAKKAIELGDDLSAEVTLGFIGAPRMGNIVLGGTKDRLKKKEVQTIQIEGSPAEMICEIAEKEGFDLILVGNKGMSGAKRFLLGSVPNTVSHYAPCDVLIARTATKSLTDIGVGEGGIVVVGGDRVALYKDEAGKIYSLSAKCTHLGCTVNWNTSDRTWDCPCHGSRYNYDGEVVQGPASRPLPKHSL